MQTGRCVCSPDVPGNGLTIFYDFESLSEQEMLLFTQDTIHQGRFSERPSEIEVALEFEGHDITNVQVSGHVVDVAEIRFAKR